MLNMPLMSCPPPVPSPAKELCQVLIRSLPNRHSTGYLSAMGAPYCRQPQPLHSLCVRTAAIYATTSLYEFHDKQKSLGLADGEQGDNDGVQQHQLVHESAWEQVFPLLDQHFLRLVPAHRYEQFLDSVLESLEVAGHFDQTGKQLMQYIVLFFPRHIRRFRVAHRFEDHVLMPTVCCLHKCANIEELYLERADSPGITTYLLAHVLKFVNGLKVLSLPAQADDDVLSTVGINCPLLESIVLTDTTATNCGLSWLLCCRRLHTVILPGVSHSGITPKGAALLLNGLPTLRHLVCDLLSEVLAYTDFNTSEAMRPAFGLKTVLIHSVELLSSNHLELVTKLCPEVEWLSLDSALFYNLEGLGHFPRLDLLRINYKGRPLDQTVFDFFDLNSQRLSTLQLLDVKDVQLEDLFLTVGRCPRLETLVLSNCSLSPDPPHDRGRPSLSQSVERLQLISTQLLPCQLLDVLKLFPNLRYLDLDACELDGQGLRTLLEECSSLETVRCPRWPHVTSAEMSAVKSEFKGCCRLLATRQAVMAEEDEDDRSHTLASRLLAEYAEFSATMRLSASSSSGTP